MWEQGPGGSTSQKSLWTTFIQLNPIKNRSLGQPLKEKEESEDEWCLQCISGPS